MIAEAALPTSPASPSPTGCEGKDYSAGVEMDDSQEWIGELLAERIRRIDAGEVRALTLEEFREKLRNLRREKSHRP